jgi:pSer/pThr/pTyr-binding forkhead associated (FHA) protein
MPKLIVKKDEQVVQEFEIEPSKSVFTLGSAQNNDIVLPDKNVAAKHAKIEQIFGKYYIVDLNSTWGTHLNGRPIFKREQIVHGDTILIRDYSIVFDNLIQENSNFVTNRFNILDDDEFENLIDLNETPGPETETLDVSSMSESNTSIPQLDPGQFNQDQAPTLEAIPQDIKTDEPDGGLPSTKKHFLIAIYGPYLGKKFPLNSEVTKIGRDTKLNDIIIRHNEKGELDSSISRRHATVSYKDGQYFVSDKRSKTRTYVNQRKLDPSDEIPLHVGDEIEIVSDQKSSIFRLVTREPFNFSPPKLAGPWRIRNGRKLGRAISLFLIVISLLSLATSLKSRIVLTKRPDPLNATEEIWYSSASTELNEKGENATPPKSHLALGDLNGDQKVDVVFTEKSGHLTAVDGKTKKIIWKNLEFQVNKNIALVLEDLNANRSADILAVGQDSRIRALDGTNGAEIWLSPILGEKISGAPIVADLNGDQLKDFLVCTQDGQIYIGYSDIYTVNWKAIKSNYDILSVPSAWERDNYGGKEVFIGTEEGIVLIVDGNMGEISKIYDFNDALSKVTGVFNQKYQIRSPIGSADLNHNQIKDVLIGSTSGDFLAMEGAAMDWLWYEQLTLEFTTHVEILPPSFGDLDGDGSDEVVLVSNYEIKAIKSFDNTPPNKQVLWVFRVDSSDMIISSAALADVNKDHSNDVIVSNQRGTIYILNGQNGAVLTRIDHEKNPVISPVLVADLEGDGNLDIVLIREDFNIYSIKTNSSIPKNSVIWGQVHSNSEHTGRLDFVSPKPWSYDVTMAASALLILSVVVSNFSVRNRRQKIIERNQNG